MPFTLTFSKSYVFYQSLTPATSAPLIQPYLCLASQVIREVFLRTLLDAPALDVSFHRALTLLAGFPAFRFSIFYFSKNTVEIDFRVCFCGLHRLALPMQFDCWGCRLSLLRRRFNYGKA